MGFAAQLTHTNTQTQALDTTNRSATKLTSTHSASSTSEAASTWPMMAPRPVLHLGQGGCLTSPHSSHNEGHAASSNASTSEQRRSGWSSDARVMAASSR